MLHVKKKKPFLELVNDLLWKIVVGLIWKLGNHIIFLGWLLGYLEWGTDIW